jgi:hypothetical protein
MAPPPNPVADLLEAIAACLCAQITVDERPPVCFCGVIPGDRVVQNYGKSCEDDKNGAAWVRLADMYPSEGIGEQSISVKNCGSALGLEIEVGMMRQMDAPDREGYPPTDAELLAAANLTSGDAITMRRAISCCPALADKSYILGNWAPGGPMGVLIGGMWRITTAL